MELAGIVVDTDRLQDISDELTGRRQTGGRGAGVAGQEFNVNSTPQLRTCSTRSWRLAPQEDQDRLLHRRPDAREPARRPPASWTRCCATARSRSCAPPTARACSPRCSPTGGSTPRSARPSPAPAGSRRTAEPAQHPGAQPHRAPLPRGLRAERRAASFLVADYDQIELRVIAHLSERPRPRRGLRARVSTSTTRPPPGSTASSPVR